MVFIGALAWIKIIGGLVEAVVLPWLRAHKASKRAKKAEAALTAVIKGVESYEKVIKGGTLPTINPAVPSPAPSVKEIISNIAKSSGIEDKLKAMVHKITGKIK